MQVVAGISFFLLISCAWLVGLRLLLMARRTGGVPETCLGWMLLVLMGIGYPLAVGAQAEAQLGLAIAKLLQVVSNALIDVGFALIFVFTWKVFRTGRAWAGALVLVAMAALLFHWIVVLRIVAGLETMSGAVNATRYWAQIPLTVGGFGSAWSAFESLRYHGLLRRRLSLGLADPVVCNRFLLWSGMGIAMMVGGLANTYFLLAQIDVLTSPIAQSVTAITGLVQTCFLYLTFMPPAFYTRWLILRPQAAS